jgi:hypothetical protein
MKLLFLYILLLSLCSCYVRPKCPDGSRTKMKYERVKMRPERNLSY